MTRLERYKDILIPVDDVSYVEYRKPKKNAWSTDGDDNAGTYVHVRDGYVYGSIKIGKKNLLDDFKKWYDETMKRIGKGEETGIWQWTYLNPTDSEKPFDVSPHTTWTSTTTVQHDGIEHPL